MPRPLKWIREATSEEIAEAMLTVDPYKAMEIAGLVMAGSGRALGAKLDRALDDPGRVASHVVRAGLRELLK